MPNVRAHSLSQTIRPTLTPAALADIRGALRWSERKFGKVAALRYEALIVQSVRDLAEEPLRPGTRGRPELMRDNARTYHIGLSRSRTAKPRVKEPRHFILYRIIDSEKIEVARILHDSRDLALHLTEGYRLEVQPRAKKPPQQRRLFAVQMGWLSSCARTAARR